MFDEINAPLGGGVSPEGNEADSEFAAAEKLKQSKSGLSALGKRLMITYPLSLIIGYPVVYALAFLISMLGLGSSLNGNSGYLINFILNDVFVRGSALLLCYFMLKQFFIIKYKDTSTNFKLYELLFWFPLMVMLGVCGSYITNFFSAAAQLLGGSGEIRQALESVKPEGQFMFVCYLIFVGITGPILEEVMFRGVFLRALRPYGDMLAIIVTSVMFGLYHLSFSQILYTTFIGIVLAAVAVRSNNIVPSIVLHIANNFMVTFVRYTEIGLSGNETPTATDTVITAISNGFNVFLNIVPPLALCGLLLIVLLNKQDVGDALPQLSMRGRTWLLIKNKAAVFCTAVVVFLIVSENFL